MRKISASLLLLSAIIISCQKEMDENALLNPVNNFGDSSYLETMYEIDSIAGVNDTLGIWRYEYDNLRRVTVLTEFSNSNGAFDGKAVYRYFYAGNDTLPFKQIYYSYNYVNNTWQPGDSLSILYFYDSQGRNLKDSAINYDNTGTASGRIVNTYQYSAQNIYMKEFYYDGVNPVALNTRKDTSINDGNGNLLFSKLYYVDSNGDDILEYTSQFTYDNKPSPFKKLSNFRTLVVTPFGETFFYEMQGTNNRLRANEVHNTGNSYTEDLTGKYSYLPNGYPNRIMEEYATDTFYITSFKYRAF